MLPYAFLLLVDGRTMSSYSYYGETTVSGTGLAGNKLPADWSYSICKNRKRSAFCQFFTCFGRKTQRKHGFHENTDGTMVKHQRISEYFDIISRFIVYRFYCKFSEKNG